MTINISNILKNSIGNLFNTTTAASNFVANVGKGAKKFDNKIEKNAGKKKGGGVLPAYVKSSAQISAEKAYSDWKKSMPKAPKLSYTSGINDLISKLSGRKFSYDHTTDPAYIAYKNAYTEQGRLAMEDTVGVASANTGGYSNSYAVSAANQAYNNYVSKVGEVIPELYEAAYNRYKDETDELYDRIELLSSLNDDEWSRYSDVLSAYYDEGNLLMDELDRATDADLDRYKLLVANM